MPVHDGISGWSPAPRRVATCQIENHRKKSRGGDKMRNCGAPSGELLHCGRRGCGRMCKDVCVEGCGRKWKDVRPKCLGFLHSRPGVATSAPRNLIIMQNIRHF